MPAPIALFVFHRPEHTLQTLQALTKNSMAAESELFIFGDGPRGERDAEAVRQTREVCTAVTGFRAVHCEFSESNKGLAKSIITGVTRLVQEHGSVIVMEDDLVTSPHFLRYMNSALEFYRDVPEVMSISAYTPPEDRMQFPTDFNGDVYFNLRNSSWGWGTWPDRWALADWEVSDYEEFRQSRKLKRAFNRGGADLTWMLGDQMEGYINSWAIRWTYAHFKQKKLSVCPRHSYVDNIGLDGSGTHFNRPLDEHTILSEAIENPTFRLPAVVDEDVMEAFRKHLVPSIRRRIWRLSVRLGLYKRSKVRI